MTDPAPWAFLKRVTRPALLAAPTSFLDDIQVTLAAEGIRDAVARHDTPALFDWLVGLIAFQGIADARAASFIAAHGNVR